MILEEDQRNFSKLAESLKLSRRADLEVFGDDETIEELYVDPFQNNFIINSMLLPNSTLLIGRKGTGKSTIILKLQKELKKRVDSLSIYLDVKTIFEQSKTVNINDDSYRGLIPEDDTIKYLLYKAFISEVLENIKRELKEKLPKKENCLEIIKKVFNKTENYEKEIDDLLSYVAENEYKDVTMLKQVSTKSANLDKENKSREGNISGGGSTSGLFAKFSGKQSTNKGFETSLEEEFSKILTVYYNPKALMLKIQDLLKKVGIKHLYICLDDYSEIDKGAIKIFVDSIIAPLNNWSEEFIKFKICAYPNRYYLGEIDSTKIDILNLDYYNLYSATNTTDSLIEALDYTKRLLDARFKYFCNKPFQYFVDEKIDVQEFYKEIFFISANVPRNIGRILWYVDRFTISQGKPITLRDLRQASEQFYDEAIAEFFTKTMHVKLSYDERLTKYHLEEILKTIINKAKINKTEIGKSDFPIFAEYTTNNAPTSFFFTLKDTEYENVLSSLELNYFITKYNEQKDRDGKKINVYWINHGLCQKESIIFGRGNDRKYIVARRFDYGPVIKKYIDGLQDIECIKCHSKFEMDELETLKKYNMACYKCKDGICVVKDMQITLPTSESNFALPEIEYDLLKTLSITQKELYASQIACELDCSYQLISKRAKKLKEMGYIESKKETRDVGPRNYYYLTQKANEDFDFQSIQLLSV